MSSSAFQNVSSVQIDTDAVNYEVCAPVQKETHKKVCEAEQKYALLFHFACENNTANMH